MQGKAFPYCITSSVSLVILLTFAINAVIYKTYRGDKTYIYNTLTNIEEVASAKRDDEVEEIKRKQRISGFNSIFAVSSVPMAKLYYQEFKKQMTADTTKKLRVATIFSYGANEEDADGILDEENSEASRHLAISYVSATCKSVWTVQFPCSGIRMPGELFFCRVSRTTITGMSMWMENKCRVMWI